MARLEVITRSASATDRRYLLGLYEEILLVTLQQELAAFRFYGHVAFRGRGSRSIHKCKPGRGRHGPF